jgi:hypothetical protein
VIIQKYSINMPIDVANIAKCYRRYALWDNLDIQLMNIVVLFYAIYTTMVMDPSHANVVKNKQVRENVVNDFLVPSLSFIVTAGRKAGDDADDDADAGELNFMPSPAHFVKFLRPVKTESRHWDVLPMSTMTIITKVRVWGWPEVCDMLNLRLQHDLDGGSGHPEFHAAPTIVREAFDWFKDCGADTDSFQGVITRKYKSIYRCVVADCIMGSCATHCLSLQTPFHISPWLDVSRLRSMIDPRPDTVDGVSHRAKVFRQWIDETGGRVIVEPNAMFDKNGSLVPIRMRLEPMGGWDCFEALSSFNDKAACLHTWQKIERIARYVWIGRLFFLDIADDQIPSINYQPTDSEHEEHVEWKMFANHMAAYILFNHTIQDGQLVVSSDTWKKLKTFQLMTHSDKFEHHFPRNHFLNDQHLIDEVHAVVREAFGYIISIRDALTAMSA